MNADGTLSRSTSSHSSCPSRQLLQIAASLIEVLIESSTLYLRELSPFQQPRWVRVLINLVDKRRHRYHLSSHCSCSCWSTRIFQTQITSPGGHKCHFLNYSISGSNTYCRNDWECVRVSVSGKRNFMNLCYFLGKVLLHVEQSLLKKQTPGNSNDSLIYTCGLSRFSHIIFMFDFYTIHLGYAFFLNTGDSFTWFNYYSISSHVIFVSEFFYMILFPHMVHLFSHVILFNNSFIFICDSFKCFVYFHVILSKDSVIFTESFFLVF